MDYYAWCKTAYDNGYATTDQLKIWVAKGKITSDNYKTITGIDYTA